MLWKLELKPSDFFNRFSDVLRVNGVSHIILAHVVNLFLDFLQLISFILSNGQVSHAKFWKRWLSVDSQSHGALFVIASTDLITDAVLK